MKSLSVHNLTYAYHKNDDVIKNITAQFDKHSIHTLVGLNGSGKTTLIKLLSGLFIPKSGEVFLEKENIQSIDYLTRSKHLAYVRQGSSTGDDHYVKDYLSFGMMNKLAWYKSPTQDDFRFVELHAKKLNIEHLLEKRMNELSGGQKQIVMICRAVVQNTDIIILDEPTSALDFKNQSLVLKTLKGIVLEERKTIILSTHNPNHALYLDSNVFLMHEGAVVDSGPASKVVTVERLKRIYGDAITYTEKLKYKEVTIN